MVAGGATAGLAVSRPEPRQPDVRPSTRARRARGGAGGGHRQAGWTAYVAPQLRDASAGERNRHPRDPGSARNSFFLPVRVLSRLFRRLFLDGPAALREAGRLAFFGDLASLAERRAFDAALAPLRRAEWVVYATRPFAGPRAVLAYLSRYRHRVAISNSRLIALDEARVSFKWKDYRIKGRDRLKIMTLDAAEFIRRFLTHVLPSRFHRIRHYGLFASAVRARNIDRARQLLAAPEAPPQPARAEADSEPEQASAPRRCPCCGGRMIVIETFEGARPARPPPPTQIRIDTS